jgi:hypothetical protein
MRVHACFVSSVSHGIKSNAVFITFLPGGRVETELKGYLKILSVAIRIEYYMVVNKIN